MTTTLTPMQSFEQNIKDRLTADIGSLIPDEALTALVNRAIEEAFFKPQEKITFDRNHYQTKEVVPAVLVTVVKELLREQVKACLQEFITKNEKLIAENMKAIVEKSSQELVVDALTTMFNQPLMQFKQALNQQFMNNNMQPVY